MVSANKIEILRIAETVAQEKMIDKSIVISALEEAIEKAAKSNYGEENEVVVEINQENGGRKVPFPYYFRKIYSSPIILFLTCGQSCGINLFCETIVTIAIYPRHPPGKVM